MQALKQIEGRGNIYFRASRFPSLTLSKVRAHIIDDNLLKMVVHGRAVRATEVCRRGGQRYNACRSHALLNVELFGSAVAKASTDTAVNPNPSTPTSNVRGLTPLVGATLFCATLFCATLVLLQSEGPRSNRTVQPAASYWLYNKPPIYPSNSVVDVSFPVCDQRQRPSRSNNRCWGRKFESPFQPFAVLK